MSRNPKSSTQPIPYNHSIHINDIGLDCIDCHVGVNDSERATLPTLDICESCHEEMIGTSNAESLIVDAIENDEEITWIRIYKLPDHIYFSHRRHVSLGNILCSYCHGDIENIEEPISSPAVDLSMEYCMSCHEDKKVNNDCLTCHR